ncbi:MAG: sugar MFS transporter [Bacteroidota bacterium]
MKRTHSEQKSYLFSLVILGILFFVFGFATWINGVLIPFLKTACELNDFTAYFVTFAFYISYFVMAIPSSMILKKIGFKNGMSIGLFVMAVGALMFIPAAFSRSYILFLTGLFVMGTGLALLQTAVNPYVTIIGPIESAAKRISIMGICNKIAGVLAPIILASLVLHDAEAITSQLKLITVSAEKEVLLNALAQRLIAPYLLMAGILLLLALLVRFANLPEIVQEKEAVNADKNITKKTLWSYPQLWVGVIALFFYVGVEVIAGDTIIRYGQSLGIAMESAKYFTSLTLIAMVVGYFVGIALIPRVISQRTALIICTILGISLTILAITTPDNLMLTFPFIDITTFNPIEITIPNTVLFIAMLGVANSLMWPAIWPLALDGVGKFIKLGSALLIMAIAGGAVLPLIYGMLANNLGTQKAYIIAIPCYLIILTFAIISEKLKKFSMK